MIKLSDYVMGYIAGLGVKNIFMLPGGGCMHLVDSLGRNKKLKFVVNLHEQACAIAADAYSQYTGNIGAALVTTGPGGTNAITGVAASWIESTPVLIISGQVKKADLMLGKGVRQIGPQEVDIVSLVKPITKYAATIMEPKDIKYHLDKAVYYARERRMGPVWLDIPLDVQGAMIDKNKLKEFIKPKQISKEKRLNNKINRLIKLINQSKRPIILAGNGIRLAKGINQFKKLIKETRIPVLTTWRSLDILPQDHPLYVGRPGSVGQRGANFAQQNADLIICIGARLDVAQVAYNYGNFARAARKVIVDIDEYEIEKIATKIDIKFNLDAARFLNALLIKANQINLDTEKWLNRCQSWKKKYPVVLAEFKQEKKFLNTYVLVDTLSELLTKDDLIVPGSSGSCSEITMQTFKVKQGQRIFNSPGLGAMGFGLPASIGACIASGKRRTICLVGDGGLQHNIQELELLKRYQLPIKVFVLNNNAYASIRATHQKFFGGRLVGCDPSSGLTLPDTLKIAKAYGLKTFKLSNHQKLKEKINLILNSRGPVVCEVMVNPDLLTQPKVSSEAKPDGQMVSKPMEDLWPFLDRKEFKANMILKPIEEP
ncbi:MAG: thiamine pyrophosphate-binding protein [Candidatus Omnitrophota bacterium]|nr:thiamine pyrophosphate-binding protein [Candidatus Omnitrophota bacterium]